MRGPLRRGMQGLLPSHHAPQHTEFPTVPVLGGFSSRASRASSSAIRASAASNRLTNGSKETISASFSATVSLLRSISGVTPMLNQVARDPVNHLRHHLPADPPGRLAFQGEQLRMQRGYKYRSVTLMVASSCRHASLKSSKTF